MQKIRGMKYILKLSAWVESHITLLVVLVTAVALFFPVSFVWMETKAVTPILGIIMFGMGLTIRPGDFKPVILHPKEILVGELAQFVVMPALAFLISRLLQLPEELALGVILVGCCPGGTASNVICYLAKGDITLSVAMTGVSTLLAPVLTPALVYLLAGQNIEVDMMAMFMSIVQVVILPILLGFVVNHFFSALAQRFISVLPLISTLSIAAIIGIVVSHNAANILSCSLLVGIAVVLHNVLGLALGYGAGRLTGMAPAQRTAISIEVGMQNSGLATSLATAHFALFPMASVPGAIFSVWHNFSGSLAAALFRSHSKS